MVAMMRRGGVMAAVMTCAGGVASGAIVEFELDPARSLLQVTGGDTRIGGTATYPISQAEAGSWQVALAGTLEVELLEDSLLVLATSEVRAVEEDAYLPGVPAAPGTPAPGAFATEHETAPALGFDFVSVIRDLEFGLRDDMAKAVSASGVFDASGTAWRVASGVMDRTEVTPMRITLTTIDEAMNMTPLSGTLSEAADVQVLSMPVEIELEIFDDGRVLHFELSGMVEASRPLTPCTADTNGDGLVDFTDLNMVLDQWDETMTPGSGGDVSGDGVVDFEDLNLVLEEWDRECVET